jgi:hypothetical protein
MDSDVPASALHRLVSDYPGGHPHFRDRVLSRRSVLGGSLAALGALATVGGPWRQAGALAARPPAGAPVPIPNGITVNGKLFHVFPPGSSVTTENSTIFNMNASLGVASVNGQGTGTSAAGPVPLFFGSDMRFMDGEYVDAQGVFRRATFGFV